MIIITDCSKDIKIPAGLGDNAGVVYETAGVKSVNGEQGDVTLKTVNGESLTGEGNIEIQAGVESVNGKTGEVEIDIPTKVSELQNDADYQNGEQVKTAITDALIGVSAGIEWMTVNEENYQAVYKEVSSNWENGNYTGKKMFKYIKDGKTMFATNVQYLTDHSVSFIFLNGDNYDVANGNAKLISAICWQSGLDISETKMQSKCYIFKNLDIRSADNADGYNQEIYGYFKELYSNQTEMTKRPASMFYIADWDSDNNRFKPPYYLIQNVTQYNSTDGEFNSDSSFRASVIWYSDENKYTQKIVCITSNGGIISLNQMTDGYTLDEAKSYTDEAIKNIPSGGAVTTHLFYSVDVRQESDKNEHNMEVFKLFDKAVQEGGDFQNFYIASGNAETVEYPYWSIISVLSQGSEFEADKSYRVLAHGYNGDKIIYSEICLTSLGGVISISQPNALIDRVPNCLIWVSNHRDEGTDISAQLNLHGCESYMCFSSNGNDYEIIYSIVFNQGYGDNVKGVQVPLNVWNDGTNAFFSFDINDKRFIYKRTDNESFNFQYVKTLEIPTKTSQLTNDSDYQTSTEVNAAITTATSNKVTSSSISNIVVLTQDEYDALTSKDENTMYCIKG